MNSRDWTIVLLVILGAFVLLPVLGMSLWGFGGMMGPGMMGPGMMGRGMMGGWYGGGFGGGGWSLLMLVLIVAGIVLITRGFIARPTRADEPLAILKARLARGEITREQFEELKQAIQSTP